MATVQTSYPFAGSPILSEDQWRAMQGVITATGIIHGELLGLQAYADSSGMQVKVRTGRAFVKGQFYENPSSPDITLPIASNSSGNPRTDRIVLRNTFGVGIALAVLQGTPAAGNPAPPALTQSAAVWEIPVARISFVDSGAVTIAAAKVIDERQYVKAGNRNDPTMNILVNGGMEIWQRGAGTFTAHNQWGPDRWRLGVIAPSTLTVTQELVTISLGSRASAKLVYAHSGAGLAYLEQPLEDWGLYRSCTLTVAADVRTTVLGTCYLGIHASDGTFSVSAQNQQTNTFERLVCSYQVPASGLTSLVVRLTLFGASADVRIDNVQMVTGPVPLDWAPLTPDQDLYRAQRYYEIVSVEGAGYADAASRPIQVPVRFAAEKAVVPTITKQGTWGVVNCAQPTSAVRTGHEKRYFQSYALSSAAGWCQWNADSADDMYIVEANP